MMEKFMRLLLVSVLFSNFYVFGIRISQEKCDYYGNEVPPPDKEFEANAPFAEKGEFPYMIVDNGTPRNGILISEYFVISAAIDRKSSSGYVLLGTLNEKSYSKDDIQNKSIEYAILHPDFELDSLSSNLKLYKLTEKVVINKYVRPACLPQIESQMDEELVQTGWGMTSHNERKVLDKILLNSLSDANCTEDFEYRQITTTHLKDLPSHKIWCAAEKPTDRQLCDGFQGSAVMVAQRKKAKYYLIMGVGSFRVPCNQHYTHDPTIFVRLLSYIDWIESKVWPNGGDAIATTTTTATTAPPNGQEVQYFYASIIIPILVLILCASSAGVIIFKSKNRRHDGVESEVHSEGSKEVILN